VTDTAQRIGVFGGTFDPIHHGHLAAASEVHAALGLDLMLLVPAATQPFKKHGSEASAADRLAMTRLAVQGDPRMAVSDVDIVRGGVTYSVDTLTDIAAAYPGARLFFVAGADAVARLDEWREPERLRQLATFVGVTRPGHSLQPLDTSLVLVEVPALAISSTDVRGRARMSAPIRYLVPGAVAAHIEEHGLYKGGSDG